MRMSKLFLSGAAAFMVVAAIGTTPVFAAEGKEEGNTIVTYSNNPVIEGEDGVWGVVVPAAYAFTDAKMTVDGNVELIGINGYTLEQLGTDLKVSVKAKSANNFKVVDGANNVAYSVSYGGTKVDSSTAVDAESFTTDAVATLTPTAATVTANATLANKATVKGNYIDNITYKISHTGANLK